MAARPAHSGSSLMQRSPPRSHNVGWATRIPNLQKYVWKRCHLSARAAAIAGSQGEGPWLANTPRHEVEVGASCPRNLDTSGQQELVFLQGSGSTNVGSVVLPVFCLGWHAARGGRQPSSGSSVTQSTIPAGREELVRHVGS